MRKVLVAPVLIAGVLIGTAGMSPAFAAVNTTPACSSADTCTVGGSGGPGGGSGGLFSRNDTGFITFDTTSSGNIVGTGGLHQNTSATQDGIVSGTTSGSIGVIGASPGHCQYDNGVATCVGA